MAYAPFDATGPGCKGPCDLAGGTMDCHLKSTASNPGICHMPLRSAMSVSAAILAVQSHVTEALLFYLFAALTGISALTVVASRNIVRMSVALLFTLSGV